MAIEFKPEHSEDVGKMLYSAEKLINEYHMNNDILPDRLKYIEKKLSAFYTFLIRKKAYFQGMQNARYWIRKVSHSREAIKARATNTQTTSDHIANQKIEKEISDETYAVWRYEDLNGFCRGLDKIFISIAHQLKDYEKERIITNQQSNNGQR
jgi:hypothetical protein